MSTTRLPGPTVATLTVTTPSDREVQITRTFDAPRPMVFDCWTIPELLKGWLHGPDGWRLEICEIDLEVGGAARYVWRHRDGQAMGMSATYREIVRPCLIVATELFDEDWTGGETLGTVVFTEVNGKTLLTQTILYPSQAARDGALGTGMTSGMADSYAQLDARLASLQHGAKGAA
ncbi:MAG: ATPase [Mesorhizobium sp.]|uniref:SRPBCC family protein n=1 Tax=Mesorhizobium sp. TaxID=1871066 RepID=UPI000FE38BEF|nr:SRPBCC family protein [Mesorhizobium sp.]RWA77535.1 MAG: ATPase [Mesorhizobium sp.]RWC05809.1 MAG: ATPase [Mesorhizobium sp.]RWK26250.1 MAG: ATPase [Mesorhizobium sp.]RWK36896.1 MAG: ATPase [Mesorhizobium sp.]